MNVKKCTVKWLGKCGQWIAYGIKYRYSKSECQNSFKDGAREKCKNKVGLRRETEKQRRDKSQKMAAREIHYLRPRLFVSDIFLKKRLALSRVLRRENLR
jgi:hypothetical protein